MAILDSVKELASKLGAETSGRDITEQINLINKKLDETSSSGRDIAEAVRTYSENAGGGGSDFNSIVVMGRNINNGERSSYYLTLLKPADENGTYNVHSHGSPGSKTYTSFTLLEPATKINFSYSNLSSGTIIFTPTENFDGFYYNNNIIAQSGDTITPGDGKTYIAAVTVGSGSVATTVTITKTTCPFEFEMEG